MVDPVSSETTAKLAQQETREASRSEGASEDSGVDEPSFQEILERRRSGGVSPSGEPPGSEEVASSIDRVEMEGIEEAEDLESAEFEHRERLREFMEGLAERRERIDELFDRTMDGADLDQEELLEMQALIYSYSKRVELTSKVVEKGTGGLKQMMQMRV